MTHAVARRSISRACDAYTAHATAASRNGNSYHHALEVEPDAFGKDLPCPAVADNVATTVELTRPCWVATVPVFSKRCIQLQEHLLSIRPEPLHDAPGSASQSPRRDVRLERGWPRNPGCESTAAGSCLIAQCNNVAN